MIYRTEKIIRDVRVALDQNMTSDPLLDEGDIDTLSIEEIIRSKIEDGVRLVHNEAPLTMVESGHNLRISNEDFFIGEDGRGFLILPDDFMRLVVFRMSDWERPVYEAIGEDEELYLRQHSRYKGIRGNPQRPVVAIVRRSEGKVLEFYSCRDFEGKVEQAAYIPIPKIESGGIEISEDCYRAAIYRIAALVLAELGNEGANVLIEMSRGMLE